MKKILLTIIAIAAFASADAQDRWTVQLNSKTLLAAKNEDTATNIVLIKDVKKGALVITFTPGITDSKFGRKLAVYGTGDSELYAKEAFGIALPAASLKKWKTNHSQIKIYSWPVTNDPLIKLKVRRVHLCTIKFK